LIHFIEFSGVTCPKMFRMIAAFWPAVRRFWSVATPKYCLPRLLIASWRLLGFAGADEVVDVVVLVVVVVGVVVMIGLI
jgi:hypothetical protein